MSLTPLQWVIGGTGLVGTLAIGFLYLRLDAVSAQRDLAVTHEQQASADLKEERAAHEEQITALAIKEKQTAARYENMSKTLNMIEKSDESENGPVAPLLQRTVDSLYNNAEAQD